LNCPWSFVSARHKIPRSPDAQRRSCSDAGEQSGPRGLFQAEIRNEIIFDTLISLSQSSQAHSLHLAKLQAFSGLFSSSRGEPTDDRKQALERYGEEISRRMQKAEEGANANAKANGGVDNPVYFSPAGEHSRRRTITIQLPDNIGRRSSTSFTGIDDRASNADMTGGGVGGALSNVIARHRQTLSAHPMGMILNQQQPPTRASLSLSNIRASNVQGVHQL
jgi:hypothetical protein